MTAREELVRAIGEAILAEARKWPHVPGDRYGARLAPMGATEIDLGRAALAAIDAAGWRPPLPGSETEWGRRWPDGTVRCISDSRAQAEDTIFPATQIVSREVGPWTEVQP